MIQAWHFLETFSWCFWSKLPDWPFENSRWRPIFKMAAILHLQVGVGPKKNNNIGRFEWSWCPFICLKATGIIYCSFVAIWKIQNDAILKKGAIFDFQMASKNISRKFNALIIICTIVPLSIIQCVQMRLFLCCYISTVEPTDRRTHLGPPFSVCDSRFELFSEGEEKSGKQLFRVLFD